MAKSKEHFEHGEHNEKVSSLLELNGQFDDWTITTAFYSALHFVKYKIFPFSKKIGEVTKKFENFDEWFSHKRHTGDHRHEVLKNLVAEHCPAIHPEYDWLLGELMSARYHRYQFDKAIVNRAISNLKKIKKHCEVI